MAIKALVIDDEVVVKDFLTRFLRLESVDASGVSSGIEALNRARSEVFDIVFIDARMPEMDGLEVLRELKKLNPMAEYVLITGYVVKETIDKGIKEGFSHVLKKPFDIEEIRKIVSSYCKRTGGGPG